MDKHARTATVVETKKYTNYTNSTIYIKTQGNVPICCSPCGRTSSDEEHRPHLEVRIVYEIVDADGIRNTLDTIRALESNSKSLGKGAEELKNRLLNRFQRGPGRGPIINFEFDLIKRVYSDDILKKKALYVKELDQIISFDARALSIPHPNSNEGLQRSDVVRSKEHIGQAGIWMKVVDNLCIADLRYCWAAKHLIPIPSVTDESKDSGVYYTLSLGEKGGIVNREEFFLSFDEAEVRLGLYRSKSDAESNGNPKLATELEIVRLQEKETLSKGKLTDMAMELARIKHDYSVRAAEDEAALTRSKAETASLKESIDFRKVIREDSFDEAKKKRDTEFETSKRYREDILDEILAERKDRYDERSHYRKDTSEIIKFVPGIAVGLLGMFAIYSKMYSNKSS
jgi:hypothetical protein